MIAKIMRILYSKKTRDFLLTASLVVLLSAGLAQPAMALNFGQLVLNGFLTALSSILGLFGNLFSILSSTGLNIAVALFNWVASPNFISLSYTNPAQNPYIAIGWELTRSLANIIFVIALVVIGIGTALRISGYQMQKTLPTLILIALLINFTPVIAGLIVDASNIVMNFFMSGSSQGGNFMAQMAQKQLNLIKGLYGNLDFWRPGATDQALASMIASWISTAFNVAALVIYLLYALLLIFRYVAIWLLVIMSPFAFACYILPKTRGYFSQWWKMFIQWSILGVIMGFFLYLSNSFIFITSDLMSRGALFSGTMGDAPETPGLSVIFNNILPMIIPLILLFAGLTASMAGAPAGAQGILRAGERGLKTAGKTFGTYYGKRAWGGIKNAPANIKQSYERSQMMYRGAYNKAVGRGLSPQDAKKEAREYTARVWGRALRKEYRPPTPKGAIEGWKTARRLGMPKYDAFKVAMGRLDEWSPAGSKIAAATGGIKKALSAGWGAATHSKKKKKGEICPVCKVPLKDDSDFCMNPICRNYGKVFT